MPSHESYHQTREDAEERKERLLRNYHPAGYGTLADIEALPNGMFRLHAIWWGCD